MLPTANDIIIKVAYYYAATTQDNKIMPWASISVFGTTKTVRSWVVLFDTPAGYGA